MANMSTCSEFVASKFRLQSAPLQHVNSRTDDEIIDTLLNPPPVTSQKNVWAFWDTGLQDMPPWTRRNVIGWVRLLGPGWTVRVMDRVKNSPSNIINFVNTSYLPVCLTEGTLFGRSCSQHASDMVRLPCIFQHGGVWLDVGILLFMHLDQVCWHTLNSSTSRHEVALASADPSMMTGLAENFFIASRKGNNFIRRWMEIFLEVWKGRSNCQGIHLHPLFRHLVMGGNVARFLQKASEDKLDYFAAYLAYERLRLLEDPTDGFNGPNFSRNRIFLVAYREFASAAMLTHDDGPKQFHLLSTRYDQDHDSTRFAEAHAFCEHMSSQTAMMKLYRWREGGLPTLASLWDQAENSNSDCRPGTFAECLRYISTHFTQTRNLVPVKVPPPREEVLVAGFLDFVMDE